MLNDTDMWAVTCAGCGHVFEKPIGVLQHSDTLECPLCGARLRFHKQAFQTQLEQLRAEIKMVARANLLTEILE
jgi:rRNA maturation endonuclease Nob1